MNYTTYISAAEKLATFGQKNKSMEIIKHAIGMEERKIKELEFDILVGEVKPFNGAKFLSSRVIREKEGITIIFIFTSGDPLLPNSNTHRINDEFSLSSDEHILPRFAVGDFPKHWRLFLGVCGWSPGQLIGEIKGNPPWNQNTSWCYCGSNTETVFGSDSKDQWCESLDRSAQEFAQNILL